jgi:hypothetical protein
MIARAIRKKYPRGVPGIVLLVLLSVSPAVCETFYQWQNGSGESFYSNVSPPAGGSSYQTINMGRDEGGEVPSVTDPSAGSSPLETPATISSLPHEFPPVSVMHALNERINRRKNEISAVEQLLKKHASDEGLRRSLMRKKRYLAEELIYLAELNP